MVRFLVIAASVSTVSAKAESKECRIRDIDGLEYEHFTGLMTKKRCKDKVTAFGMVNHWAWQKMKRFRLSPFGKCYGFNSDEILTNTQSKCKTRKFRMTTQGSIIKQPIQCDKFSSKWKDLYGKGCDQYDCSWLSQAKIDERAKYGCSASQVCPGCVAGISMCADPQDQKLNDAWREDVENKVIDCRGYEVFKYCTKDGSYGAGWDKEWRTFSDNTDRQGKSALDACCACGAGSVNKSTTLQPEISTPQTQDKLDELIVEEPNEDCKGREEWTDKNGSGCDVYQCDQLSQAQIDGWANGGCSASQVCDGCKAGISMCANPNDQKQNDDWTDDQNMNCATYEFNKYCTNDKQPGNGWQTTDWGNISEIVGNNGKSALDSCCACGALSGIESATRLLKD